MGWNPSPRSCIFHPQRKTPNSWHRPTFYFELPRKFLPALLSCSPETNELCAGSMARCSPRVTPHSSSFLLLVPPHAQPITSFTILVIGHLPSPSVPSSTPNSSYQSLSDHRNSLHGAPCSHPFPSKPELPERSFFSFYFSITVGVQYYISFRCT